MVAAKGAVSVRTFFLNERHELAPGEKKGGGSVAKYAEIDWHAKSQRLHRTLRSTAVKLSGLTDPLRERRYYLVALPVPQVEKLSKNKAKAPSGRYMEATNYRGEHSLVFRRLGLDLIDVEEKGRAVVHGTKDHIDRLLVTAQALPVEGIRQQARWMTIDSFAPIPSDLRVDRSWLDEIPQRGLVDTVIELQPLLTRTEFDDVLRALAQVVREHGGSFTRSGSDFSGRHWVRGGLRRKAIEMIAAEFYSVQSIHPPLTSSVEAALKSRKPLSRALSQSRPSAHLPPATALPCVGVVDTGVPVDHLQLGPYRRSGGYAHPDAPSNWLGDHGSFVASRVVFGDLDADSSAGGLPIGSCSFLDVMVALDDENMSDKGILDGLAAVVGTSPDVRVFNLSLGGRKPLNALDEVERRERLIFTQDLDNFVFARDVLVVIAAGNSPIGLVPAAAYPDHVDDPAWALGAWASGFNTLTCGSAVEKLSPNGLASTVGWPSPFTRIGPAFPGECDAPIPEFGAHGGDADQSFRHRPHLGVWGLTASGDFEDRSGTSLAAPLLAREAALTFAELQRACAPGTRAYAATVKAFLALTAIAYPSTGRVQTLTRRTLGFGKASANRLGDPIGSSAVFVWQGLLSGPDHIARVQVPIPLDWWKKAALPTLRISCAWDTPVHSAVTRSWGCRRVSAQLRTGPGAGAVPGTHGQHGSHPLWVRDFDLEEDKLSDKEIVPASDLWILEVSYAQVADYYPGIEFSPQQRVGIAMELWDRGESATSPQTAVQALPTAATMVQLSSSAVSISNPVVIRRR